MQLHTFHSQVNSNIHPIQHVSFSNILEASLDEISMETRLWWSLTPALASIVLYLAY